MDENLRKFKNEAIAKLGNNLVCLLHHGSRAKGEAYPESDYDVILIARKVNEDVLKTIRNLFERNPLLSAYLLSLHDLKTMPKGHLLEFMYAKPLYGEINVEIPTAEEVKQYLNHSRREEMSIIRHYLLFPHPRKKKAKYAYYWLKSVYIHLSFLAFIESGKLPSTRKQTIAYFEKKKEYSNGVKLLQILDNWNANKAKVAKNPDRYLFMLERFFRNAHLKTFLTG